MVGLDGSVDSRTDPCRWSTRGRRGHDANRRALVGDIRVDDRPCVRDPSRHRSHPASLRHQQSTRADEINPISTRLLDEPLRDRPVRPALARSPRWRCHHHIMFSHCLSFQPNHTVQRFRPDQLHRGSDRPAV